MRIAIAGGTGTLGSHITSELTTRGHDVRVLSRRSQQYPVDLTSGQGLAAALDGCDVVIDDASNASAPRRAMRVLVDGSKRLLAAEQKSGVAHHVGISIVGCERVPLGYYRVKAEVARVVADVAEREPRHGRVEVAGPRTAGRRAHNSAPGRARHADIRGLALRAHRSKGS
jgi:uncharacterized protein YbjT (DUF2867 family)